VACKATIARNTGSKIRAFPTPFLQEKNPIEGERKPTGRLIGCRLEFLPDYFHFEPMVSKFCRKEKYGRKLHRVKKQEISAGEGMDRTYRKKFLQGMRAEFSPPIFSARFDSSR
jgi:hypothetical protein